MKSDRRNRVIYMKASPELIAKLHDWIDKQMIRTSIAAVVESALTEFIENHPLLK